MKRILALICVLACLCALCLPVAAAIDYTIRVKAPSSMKEVYLYMWNSMDESQKNAEWPGVKMTKKVTDGTWDKCWGDPNSGDVDGNYVLTLEEAGNVVITFNESTKTITTEFVAAPVVTEPSTEATEPSTEATEPSEPVETKPADNSEDKSEEKGNDGLWITLLVIAIVAVGALDVFLIIKRKKK